MIAQVIQYFESIDPILAALYATLFTWFLTALGASLVFFFKSMNRAVLDGKRKNSIGVRSNHQSRCFWGDYGIAGERRRQGD